jgi:protein gp37
MFREKRQYGQDPERVVRSKTKFYDPLKWPDPAFVFTCSWSDFFIAEADQWRDEAWDIIRRTPHLTYQILTKRPARIRTHLPSDWPFTNVWLGVSIESRQYLYRADVLPEIPATVRFLSLEPLLEDLGPLNLSGIGWVIIGGESGPKHRPFEIPWLESIVQQCREAHVPVFVKQDSGARAGQRGRIPDELWIRELPRG